VLTHLNGEEMKDWLRLPDKELAQRLGLLLLLVVLLRFSTLGAYPLMDPTEGRYAEIGREMVTTGNWVTPQLEQGKPFWGKPPLSFWMTAICFKVLGISELSARLASFIFILFMGLLTYAFARHLEGRVFAIFSVLILATTGLFHFIAGGVMTDPCLGATVTLTMVSYAMALRSESKSSQRLWGYGFFIGLGSCALAKGLVGWVLIGFAIFPWIVWHRRFADTFKKLPWVTGTLLMLIIAVPWHIMAERRTPGFLYYFFVGEHFKRFLVPEWQGDLYATPHNLPRGTIIPLGIVAALPWTVILVFSCLFLRRQGKRASAVLKDPWLSYNLFWWLSPLVFFTLSSNIMITYVLPGMPAFALLTAWSLRGVLERTELSRRPWFATNGFLFGSLAVVPAGFLIIALAILPREGEEHSQKHIIRRFRELSLDTHAELVYTDDMPYTGEFYSEGLAIDIPDVNAEKIRAKFKDGDQDYFAIRNKHLDDWPPEALSLTLEVGRFGKYVLRKEMSSEEIASAVATMEQPAAGPVINATKGE